MLERARTTRRARSCKVIAVPASNRLCWNQLSHHTLHGAHGCAVPAGCNTRRERAMQGRSDRKGWSIRPVLVRLLVLGVWLVGAGPGAATVRAEDPVATGPITIEGV